jgi:hypothetical protein
VNSAGFDGRKRGEIQKPVFCEVAQLKAGSISNPRLAISN